MLSPRLCSSCCATCNAASLLNKTLPFTHQPTSVGSKPAALKIESSSLWQLLSRSSLGGTLLNVLPTLVNNLRSIFRQRSGDVSWSSLNTLPLCSATRLPPEEEEARGFASPPHDGFAFIAESTPSPRGDAPAHVQFDTKISWGSSSLSYLQEVFSQTELPVLRVFENSKASSMFYPLLKAEK